MANYSLVTKTNFKPFTFDEMIKPLLLYAQAYREAEDKYNALSEGAATLESMLNKDIDINEYQQYQDYLNSIEEASDRLSKDGLSAELKSLASKYKTDFVKKIYPIQQAAERRKQMQAVQEQLGPDFYHEFDASTTPLGVFMQNPLFSPKKINIKNVRERSAAEFGQLAKELNDFAIDPNMYKDSFNNTVVAKYGYTRGQVRDIANAIRNGADINDVAAKMIYDNIYNSTGVDSWVNNKREAQGMVNNAIAEGVIGALGQSTPQIVTNQKAIKDYEHQKHVELENLRYQHEIDKANRIAADKEKENSIKGSQLFNPLPIRSFREISKNNKEFEKWKKKRYIEQNEDGSYYITDEGIKNMYSVIEKNGEFNTSGYAYYNGNLTTPGYASLISAMHGDPLNKTYKLHATNFGSFIESIYGDELKPKINSTGKLIYPENKDMSKLNDFVEYNKEESYDTNHTTEFDIKLDSNYGKEVFEQFIAALNNDQKLEVLDWGGDKFETIEEKEADSFGDNARVKSYRIRFDPKTKRNEITAIVLNKDNEKFRIKVPINANPTQFNAAGSELYNTYIYKDILDKGKTPASYTDKGGYVHLDFDTNGNPKYTDIELSDSDRKLFEELLDKSYSNIYESIMKAVRLSKTKDFDYE